MKTHKIISIKTLSSMVLIISLLSTVACVEKQKKSNNDEKQSSVSESKVKPPKMDIHTAAFMGDLETISLHIAAGSDLNVKDQYGSTPLTIAATFGKTEIAKALINGSADLNIKNAEGSTPLHTAAFFCRTKIVKALVAKDADKSLRNNYGSTALESVSGSFDQVKPIYAQIAKQLGPLGLKLDFDRIEKTRPIIADLLK